MMNVLLIVLKVVASLAFLVAGIAKLAKAKLLVAQFHDFRLPLEIMYFIGVVELLGATALWFEVLTPWVFSGLACLMAGALKSHIVAKHSVVSLLPAAALFCLCVGAALLANWLQW